MFGTIEMESINKLFPCSLKRKEFQFICIRLDEAELIQQCFENGRNLWEKRDWKKKYRHVVGNTVTRFCRDRIFEKCRHARKNTVTSSCPRCFWKTLEYRHSVKKIPSLRKMLVINFLITIVKQTYRHECTTAARKYRHEKNTFTENCRHALDM